MKNSGAKTTDMQSESEEAEVKLNVSNQKETIKETIKEEKLSSTNQATGIEESAVDKERVDGAVSEQISSEPQTSTKTVQKAVDSGIISQEKEGVSLENASNAETKEAEEQEDNIELMLEQSPKQDGENKLDDKRSNSDNKEEELPAGQDELKNGINEKEEVQSEAQIDTNSYSVDIVESTTSEISNMSVNQNDTQKEKENIDDPTNDVSCISYDSSKIMLKDVQIRLNDCRKDISKQSSDANNAEDTPIEVFRDLSGTYGKTLRNISGRHSLSRMRHFTFRDKRISPNSSLFVNTSAMSLPQDEGIEFNLHYNNTGLSDSFSTNGSSYDRKRKIETSIADSTKKQKTESSLLNTSIGFLKDWSSPMQISTPNATPCTFETKLDISGIKDDDNTAITEPTESTKKWCVIM